MLVDILLNLLFQNTDFNLNINFDLLNKPNVFVNELKVNNNVLKKKIIDGKESIAMDLEADKVISINAETGQILYEKNKDEKQAIASITKLMTALVFLDELDKNNNLNLDSVVSVIKEDEREGAYNHLYRNEKLKVKDLLATSLIASDNNATIALARLVSNDLDEFVDKMNKKAESLKMLNTSFADPSGLDENNLSTAYDLSILISEAMKNDLIKSLTSIEKYSFKTINTKRSVNLFSTDYLFENSLFSKDADYKIIGGKTGFINEAGYCFAAEVENQNKNKIINVVLNSKTIDSRFDDFKKLTYWVFENYIWE